MTLNIITYTLGAFQVHNYLVLDTETQKAILIDTGYQPDEIIEDLKAHNAELEAILYTHAHVDHMQGHGDIRKHYPDIPAYIHPEEQFWIDALQMQAAYYGMEIPEQPKITHSIKAKQVLDFGWIQFEARFCPGHTPGGISFYCKDQGWVFTGDSLFAGSIGRTDFPRGDHQQLMHSIEKQLLTLPDETEVFSGHGPVTTIGEERLFNPHLQVLNKKKRR